MKKKEKNKGFTLLEIIAVITIIGIVIIIGSISVVKYIESGKTKTYESFKEDLRVASENYMIDCFTNNEFGCVIPEKGDDIKLTYNELVDKGYSEQIKDPEGEGYCDRSYVIAKNISDDGLELEYKVCLYCDKYQSEEAGCTLDTIDDVTKPTCDYTQLVGSSTEWSKDNKVISIGCKDNGSGCTNTTYTSSLGKDNESLKKGQITIRDNSGNIETCEVDVYVDRKNPTCELEVVGNQHNGWYNNDVVINLKSMYDDGSGILEYGIAKEGDGIVYNGETSYTATNNGIATVIGYVRDKVGNVGTCSTQVKIDKTKPTGTIYMGYEVYPRENAVIDGSEITINNIERYGDIEGIIIDFNSKIAATVIGAVYSGTINIKTSGAVLSGRNNAILKINSGTYETLKIDLEDKSIVNKISKIQVIKQESTTSVWTNKDISVYVEADDNFSGIDAYSYDGGLTYISNYIEVKTFNTIGTVKLKDVAGNISESYNYTINKIDRLVPICSFSITGDLGRNNWYTSDVILDLTKEDDGGSQIVDYGINNNSLLENYQITEDTTGKTVVGYVVDGAENRSTCSATIKKDTVEPTIVELTEENIKDMQWTFWLESKNTGNEIEGYIKENTTKCYNNVCEMTVCVTRKEPGIMHLNGYGIESLFYDELSGYWNYQRTYNMFDKNGNVVNGCLITQGHNPCVWERIHTPQDKAGNKGTPFYMRTKIGYIGANDGSGC